MKNLRTIFLITTVLTAVLLTVGVVFAEFHPTLSQVAIFVTAGLFVLYSREDDLKVSDIILLPLAVLTIYFEGLTSICLDLAIFYYIVYRFGPKTETSSVLGLAIILPLLFLSRMKGLLTEEFVIVVSWALLAVISLDWPIRKFDYRNSKPWVQWFYCLITMGIYFDNELYNYHFGQYGLLLLAVVAMLSNLNRLAALMAILSVYSIGAFDNEVHMILASTIWFDVYGPMAFFLLSPFFFKISSVSLEDKVVLFAGVSTYYANAYHFFTKSKYKESIQVSVLLFVLLIPAFEVPSHWVKIRDNFASQNWWILIPAVLAILSSYLIYKRVLQPLSNKLSMANLSYDLWSEKKSTSEQRVKYDDFIAESEDAFFFKNSRTLLFVVSVSLLVLGFLCLASIT